MKRAEGLEVIVTRRHFCGGVASCVGAAVVASCTDGDVLPIQTSGLNGPDGTQNMGSGSGSGSGTGVLPDAGVTPDGGTTTGATCPATGATDVGLASSFQMNVPKFNSGGNFFVVRDANGLYALTARCTHDGYTINAESSDFFCPVHGATFDFNGTVTRGPAYKPLVHYAMCTLAGGHVGVIKSQTVPASQRLVA